MTAIKPPQELLEELGVASLRLEVIATAPAEPARVGQGLSSSPGSVTAISNNFARVNLQGRAPAFVIGRHQLEPEVFRIEELAGDVLKVAGQAERAGSDVLLDARGGRTSGVLVDTAEGKMVIHAGPGGVTVSSLGAPEDLTAWEAWTSLPSKLSVPPPPLDAFVGKLGVEPWLAARFQELRESDGIVDQVAAVGTVLRLWTPARNDRSAAVDPGSTVRAWSEQIPARELEAAERLAVERTGRLQEDLDALADADEPSSQQVLALAHERDALESVLVVLRLAGRGSGLRAALAGADDSAVTNLSALPATPDVEADELLCAASTYDPDAWWGALATG